MNGLRRTPEGFVATPRESGQMPKASAAIFAAIAIFMCAGTSRADTQFGIQGILLSGTHYQPKGNVSGSAAGAFLQLDERWRSVQLHFEGFPSVGTAVVNTNLGPVTATLGLFAASARIRLDRLGRFWVGAGTEVLAQTTPQSGLYKVDSSRLAGTRYDMLNDFPMAPNTFIETQVALMPHLSGTVYETTSAPATVVYSITGAETASMVDLSAAYGIRRSHVDYLFGVRSINFAAKFADGREADRNVGIGLSASVRFRL
jgi:hypothetical protein